MGRTDRPKFLRRFTPTQIGGDKMTSLVYTGIITLPLGGSDALAAGEGGRGLLGACCLSRIEWNSEPLPRT